MNRQRLPVVLSAAAVAIAVLGATPHGFAALTKGPVRVALFAKNSGKVGGIAASKKPKAGKLLPLGKDGQFPVSALPAGLPGPACAGRPERKAHAPPPARRAHRAPRARRG